MVGAMMAQGRRGDHPRADGHRCRDPVASGRAGAASSQGAEAGVELARQGLMRNTAGRLTSSLAIFGVLALAAGCNAESESSAKSSSAGRPGGDLGAPVPGGGG